MIYLPKLKHILASGLLAVGFSCQSFARSTDASGYAKEFLMSQLEISFENGETLGLLEGRLRELKARYAAEITAVQASEDDTRAIKQQKIEAIEYRFAQEPLANVLEVTRGHNGRKWISRLPTAAGELEKLARKFKLPLNKESLADLIRTSSVVGSDYALGSPCVIIFNLGRFVSAPEPARLAETRRETNVIVQMTVGSQDMGFYAVKSNPSDYENKESRALLEAWFPALKDKKSVGDMATSIRFVAEGDTEFSWGVLVQEGFLFDSTTSNDEIVSSLRKLLTLCKN